MVELANSRRNFMHNLFQQFHIFLQEKAELDQINGKKGLNDYNILSISSKNSSELLHSKIIASLLDTNGLHYQGSLFLDIFLSIANIKDYTSEKSSIQLEKSGIDQENGRIDIYI